MTALGTANLPEDWVGRFGDPMLSLIRWLGFVGGTHYCPSCMNEFWADHGLHAPDCQWAADKTNA